MVKVQRTELRFGRSNLKRYLGLSYGYFTSEIDWWGDWMDHYKLVRVTRGDKGHELYEQYVVLVSEPYQVHADDLRQILDMCHKYNLDVVIGGNADHNPGCCRIEIKSKR